MQHSIGHSWDLYFLRDADGIPQATVLVSDGVVRTLSGPDSARFGM